MKKRLALAVLLTFLAACIPIGQQEQVTSETEGISVQYMANTPPPVVYGDTENLPIMLLIENKGTYGNSTGKVYLSGYDRRIIRLDEYEKALPKNLQGRGPYTPRGQTHIMEFFANVTDIGRMRLDQYNTILMATTCYEYETITGAEMCVDFNPYSVGQQQKICTPQDIMLTGGQGAPIGITQVELEPGRGVTRLIIHVQNLGGGTVFKPGQTAQEMCNPYHERGLSYSDIGHVEIEEVRVSDVPLTDCQPNPVPLTAGEGLIFCSIRESQPEFQGINTAFISPISVRLKYGYRQSTTVPIEIRPAAR